MRRSATETKAVILAAARERFAADGYERATIRAIAADARIDPSMVMRYFGNKEQLFADAAEFDLELPDLTEVPRSHSSAPPSPRISWIAGSATRPCSSCCGSASPTLRSPIGCGRSSPRNSARSSLRRALIPAGAPARAGLIASQVLGMALCRYVLAFPPLVHMERQEIIDQIGPTLQRYLTG